MDDSHDRDRRRAAKLAAAARQLKQAAAKDVPFCLGFLTDRQRARSSRAPARALPPGAAVILRDYETADRAALARRLKAACAASGALLLIGGDAALAEHVGADGLHVPAWMTPPTRRRDWIVTAACHNDAELMRASDFAADLAFLGPVFATKSHPNAPTLGADRFRAIARAARMPVLALGGVDETNAASLIGENIVGFGAIGAFNSE